MRLNHSSIQLIDLAARSLGEINDQVVYVGGATVPLYIEDEASAEPRPTEDVDCVIELVSYIDYAKLEKQLRSKGFQNAMESNAPICRWNIHNIKVDIMPTDESILGFSNRWYKEGVSSTKTIALPSGQEIKIFALPFFIASKIEAYLNRGGNDFRLSHDIEDVITILDGTDIEFSFSEASENIKIYLIGKFKKFLDDGLFIESVTGHLEQGPVNSARSKRIIEALKRLVHT